jgi:hypothetical protein
MANLTVKDSTGTTKYLSASGAGTDGDPQILKHEVSNFPTTQPVSGSVGITNFPATQPVSGSIDISNFPATQPVSGSVGITNFPATQPVSGSVAVTNFPVTQPVSGTVTVDDSNNTLTGPQKTIICRPADIVGDGTGSINMNVNGSVTPVIFRIKPSPTEVYRLAWWMLTIEDTGSFDSSGWGNNSGVPLTNGIIFQKSVNGVLTQLFNCEIKSHIDLASMVVDFNYYAFGTGNEFVTARWKVTDTGQYFRLDGANNEELQIVIRDNLTHLVSQRVRMSGYIE